MEKTKSNKQKFIITSALPYVNGIKHIGNLIGSLLPADVYARYLRLKGKDVIFICGSDEHGTPAEISAHESGKPVKEYVENMYQIQTKIYEKFNLSFDFFGQTSSDENKSITQEIFLKLNENGYIFEKEEKQFYSVQDKRFLPDRYIIGTCPNCKYEHARGDQCENCSQLLDSIDLISPKSSLSQNSELEIRKVKHLYIDLPKLQPLVENWIKKQTKWPVTTKSIAKKWLKEGLQARGITRDLKWGIPVPLKAYKNKVFYVWFDAPIGYIAITKQWANLQKDKNIWKNYWKDNSTKLIQFMGIDNVPFHTITWPCSIIGANDGYILPNFIKSFQILTYEGKKISTSKNVGIFLDEAIKMFPSDYWRYYLLSITPERQNSGFLWKGFQNAINNDLNNLLGNLLNRAVSFSIRHFEGKIPKIEIFGTLEEQLWMEIETTITLYKEYFDLVEFQKPVRVLRELLQKINKYFQDSQPWKTIRDNKKHASSTIGTLVHALRTVAILYFPLIPTSSKRIFTILGITVPIESVKWDEIIDKQSLIGNTIKVTHPLFTKITDEELEKTKHQFEKTKKLGKKGKTASETKFITKKSFMEVVLKTAKILNVLEHPDADNLFVLTINDGVRNDRKICAAIRENYSKDQLVGKNIIILDNLKPRVFRGVLSEGMVLAVEDKNIVSLLSSDRTMGTGLRIT